MVNGMPDYTILRQRLDEHSLATTWDEVAAVAAKNNSAAIDKIADKAGVYVAVALRNFKPKFTPVTFQREIE